jgi:hypothetical protein
VRRSRSARVCLPAPYYSPAMQAARLREQRRRPRRGSLQRPIDARLVRVSLLVVVLPLVIAAITVSRPGSLQVPALPPSFDPAAAVALTMELARTFPNRVPGSAGDEGAARWFAETLRPYGLSTTSDTWHTHVPGLGNVQLRNVAVVVPGSAKGAIVFVAHRDTSGMGMGTNDDATGTAVLIQLARAYGAAGSAQARPRPLHTLVFLSSDGGAWGGLGAHRFSTTSPLRHDLLAVVAVDGIGSSSPRLEIDGDGGRSPSPALVQTALARVAEQTGSTPHLPTALRQLVDLGIPFGYGDQATFLGAHVSAVRLTTADDSGRTDATDLPGRLDERLAARLGAAAQNLLGSLDAAGEVVRGTAPNVQVNGRVVHGWTIELVLIALLVPFLVGVVDLLARVHRFGVPLGPALRAMRRRLGYWLFLAVLLWFASVVGALPNGPARPPAPRSPAASDWPLGAIAAFVAIALAAWFLARRRLVPRRNVVLAEQVAGYTAALAALGVLGVLVAAAHPFALLFLVPSLYAWLWLPQLPDRAWLRDILFGVGLLGAVVVLISLGDRFALGLRTPLYLAELVTVGYVPWTTMLLCACWTAVAAQLGALAVGRYGPYSGGAARPPRGPIRESVRRAAAAAQSRRR